jgi:hypothetical protein
MTVPRGTTFGIALLLSACTTGSEWNYGLAVDAGRLWVSSVEGMSVYRYEIADLGN